MLVLFFSECLVVFSVVFSLLSSICISVDWFVHASSVQFDVLMMNQRKSNQTTDISYLLLCIYMCIPITMCSKCIAVVQFASFACFIKLIVSVLLKSSGLFSG